MIFLRMIQANSEKESGLAEFPKVVPVYIPGYICAKGPSFYEMCLQGIFIAAFIILDWIVV